MKRHQRLKVQAIQKEQYRLVKVENVLTYLLAKVNESINELKVEELHLKSSLIGHYTVNPLDEQPSTSAQAALRFRTPKEESLSLHQSNDECNNQMEGIENINKQMLTLESLLVPINKNHYNGQEEDEDDDSMDDDYVPTENSESENDEFKE